MTATVNRSAPDRVRDTIRSPFAPIADYAFLSDCHTGALVAPDGSIDWLCVPAFDAPSIFGSLLDRQTGNFRLGPYGIVHPVLRIYQPGTNVLETTWRTRNGWMVVRDALTMGPNDPPDVVTPHTRPPSDADADHMLIRTVECISGTVEVELTCDPVFDYGRTPATWTFPTDDLEHHVADATGAGQTVRLSSDLRIGIEGDRVRARHVLNEGDRVYCVLSWADQLRYPVTSPTRTPGSKRRCCSGATGWRTPGCRITDGAIRCSARPWSSRA